MTEKELKLLDRVAKSMDGRDFIDEILKPMLTENHRSLLHTGKGERDELIGYGRCLTDLLELFADCDIRLAKVLQAAQANTPQEAPPSWT